MSKIKKSGLDRHVQLSNYKIEDSKKNKMAFENGTAKRVMGYCRVSTSIQAEQGDSLEAQKENIERYCKNKGLILIDVFKECISGALAPEKRPLFSHILRMLENEEIEGIVIFKLDRLSRSINDTIRLMSEFSSKKWLFYEIKNNLSTEGAMGLFTVHLFSALNQLERSIIQERVNEVNEYRKTHDLQRGMVPFGKDLLIKDGLKMLVDNKEELETIKMIQEMRDTPVIKNGKKKYPTFKDICDYLTKEKRKNKFGGISWYPTNVRKFYYNNDYRSGKNVKNTEGREEIKHTEGREGREGREEEKINFHCVDENVDENVNETISEEKLPETKPILKRQKAYIKLSEIEEETEEEE